MGVGSSGWGREVRSFGRPEPAEEEPVDVPGHGPNVVVVDIKISAESLARLERDLAAAVRRAVEEGFANAGAQQDPEQT